MTTQRIRGRRLQRIRREHLQRHPLCVRCEEKGLTKAGTQVDHVIPLFKGGADDETNRQTLCDDCHADKTRADLGHRAVGCDTNGMPLSPGHHWHR